MLRRLVPLLALALAPAASAAETTVTELPGPSPIRAQGDLALVGVRGADGRYALSTLRDGTLTALPVPGGRRQPDADLGTDARGRPLVVATVRAPAGDRDVVVVRLHADGTPAGEPRTIGGVDTPSDEHSPTVWGGRIAFVRHTPHRPQVVLLRRLGDSQRTPSRRLPGVPASNCSVQDVFPDQRPSCRTKLRSVGALELRGRHLAERVGYLVEGQLGILTDEIRLVDTRRRSSRAVATYELSGASNSTLIDPSLDAAGRVVFGVACSTDCTDASLYRSGGHGRYARATVPKRSLLAAAVAGDAALQVADSEDGPWPVVRTDPLTWRRVGARRFR